MKPLTPTDLWWRVGIGVALMILAFVLQAGTASLAIFVVGLGWVLWAVIRGVLQVRKAERIAAERRARREK